VSLLFVKNQELTVNPQFTCECGFELMLNYHCSDQLDSEPTSVPKSSRILPAVASSIGIHTGQSPIALAAPNRLELAKLYQRSQVLADEAPSYDAHVWEILDSFRLGTDWRSDIDQIARRPVSEKLGEQHTLSFLVEEGVARMAVNLLPVFQRLVIKLGEHGVLLVMRLSGEPARLSGWALMRSNARRRLAISRAGDEIIILQHFPGLEVSGVVNSTGAGDTLFGALLAEVVKNGQLWDDPTKVEKVIDKAQQAACMTLSSKLAVSPELSNLQ
jgi:pseudouridylate synthase / pseudouridine kinase